MCGMLNFRKLLQKNLLFYKADQKAASAALFEQYGQKTNYYLRDVFMTPFQISDVKDAFIIDSLSSRA